MSGFSGIFDDRSRHKINRALLERMNEALHHRGPDAGGLHLEPGFVLAHRCLARMLAFALVCAPAPQCMKRANHGQAGPEPGRRIRGHLFVNGTNYQL
jgi:asparagine synthetase B (glutamine-hydrolysing)